MTFKLPFFRISDSATVTSDIASVSSEKHTWLIRLTGLLILLLLLFRFWFANKLPMTGDEAYFILWGKYPAGGYYDHPPMLGWWLTGLLPISHSEWVLRLPSVLLPFILGLGAWWLVAPYGKERAVLAGLLVVLQPANVWNILITTDTPLVLFSLLSVLAYVAGIRKSATGWYAASGALLGCAFMSKYFAALLGIAFAAHILFGRRDQQRWTALVFILLFSSPAPLYNLYWNSQHAWVNLLFNLVTRNENAAWSWKTPLLYLGSILYLATPFVLIAAWQHRTLLRHTLPEAPEARVALWIAGIPLMLFAVLSTLKTIGLHWILAFTPFIVIPIAIALPVSKLKKLAAWSAGIAALHLLLIATLSSLPIETWKKSPHYASLVLAVKTNEFITAITPYTAGHTLAMTSFSPAAVLSFYTGQPVSVFGEGTYHGRQDDFLTDWRTLDQKNILIISRTPPDLSWFQPYFRHLSTKEIQLHEASFYLIQGQQFNYQAYRQTVLTKIRQHFYPHPSWLPRNNNSPVEPYYSPAPG